MIVVKRDRYEITSALALLGISCAQNTEKSSLASATILYTCKPTGSPDAEILECLISPFGKCNCLESGGYFRRCEQGGFLVRRLLCLPQANFWFRSSSFLE
ncbi:signal peptide peptidase-like 2b [Echinococcus multilocularis]|uniref:Signal peptide peptidase-like 2b n=1 Tax=Echinococcus multilocularis TaxID=6211 RepID=A0A0S4MK69_ECHMU|nr:signal peptide peptidase-like 2b [Echinococcus multilocularis]